MSFVIEDNIELLKISKISKLVKIWNKIKKILDIKFHSKPAYDEKHIKTKVKAFNEVVNTIFSNNKIPKESIHYICIAAINIDFVMIIDKKNYPQFCLEECKYKIKKKKMVRFIDY